MTRYNFKTSLLVLGCALVTSASVSHAASEPEIHFYPAKKWNVVTTDVKMAGTATQKCSITNEFNNGFIVQVSGSHKWVEAMQIDFRQPAFNDGQQYDVALTVPGIKNKTLSGKAVSDSQLVINLQGQKDIYAAMRDSSVFDLTLDDNDFRFYMVGFKDSADGFERCMAGGAIEAPRIDDVLQTVQTKKTPTVNESIAYEEIEKLKPPMPEVIAPEIPKEIKSVDLTQEKQDAIENEAALSGEAPLALRAVKEGDQGRKRMSDSIAEQINENPEIADVIVKDVETSSDSPNVTAQKTVAVADPRLGRSGLVIPPRIKSPKALPKPLHVEENDSVHDMPADLEAELNEVTQEIADKQQELRTAPLKKAEKEVDEPKTIVIEEIEIAAPVAIEAPKATPKKLDDPAVQTLAAEILLEEPAGIKMPEPLKPKITVQKSEKVEADFTNSYLENEKPVPAPVAEKPSPATNGMAARISNLERQIQTLQQENTSLNADLKDALTESRQEHHSIADNNWNLERATKQFNEAERQLKRLGQQLQQERTACAVEKQELEALLFDPSVTEDAQIAKLTQLQRELEEVKAKLRTLEN